MFGGRGGEGFFIKFGVYWPSTTAVSVPDRERLPVTPGEREKDGEGGLRPSILELKWNGRFIQWS